MVTNTFNIIRMSAEKVTIRILHRLDFKNILRSVPVPGSHSSPHHQKSEWKAKVADKGKYTWHIQMWARPVWGGSKPGWWRQGGRQPQCVGKNQFRIKNSGKNCMPTFFPADVSPSELKSKLSGKCVLVCEVQGQCACGMWRHVNLMIMQIGL